MKHMFFLIFLFLTLLLSSCGLQSLLGLDSSPVLKSGVYKVEDDRGRILRIMQYKRGELHGEARGYYSDESVKWITHYRKGQKEGEQRIYYKNGRLYSRVKFKRGLLEGPLLHYTRDGHLQYSIYFKEGKALGKVVDHLATDAPAPKEFRRSDVLKSFLGATKGFLTGNGYGSKGIKRDPKIADGFLESMKDVAEPMPASPPGKKGAINDESSASLVKDLEKTKDAPLGDPLADVPFPPSTQEVHDQDLSRQIGKNETKPQTFEEFKKRYPEGGTVALEAWKMHCLINNIDYEEVIKEGI